MPAAKLWISPRLGDENIYGARAPSTHLLLPKQPHVAASTAGVTEHPVWCLQHRCLLTVIAA